MLTIKDPKMRFHIARIRGGMLVYVDDSQHSERREHTSGGKGEHALQAREKGGCARAPPRRIGGCHQRLPVFAYYSIVMDVNDVKP